MCISGAREWIPPRTLFCCTQKQPPKRSKVRVRRIITRKKRRCEAAILEKVNGEYYMEMELKNLKLYMENICIFEENEQLRRKATLLHQENLALMSEFKNKFSHS